MTAKKPATPKPKTKPPTGPARIRYHVKKFCQSHQIPSNPIKSHQIPANLIKSHQIPANPIKSNPPILQSHQVCITHFPRFSTTGPLKPYK